MPDPSMDPRYHQRGCPQHVHPTQRDPGVIAICTCDGEARPLTSECDVCGTPLVWVDGVDGEPGEWERGGLDAAWAEVEAALPEGHVIRSLERSIMGGWDVWAGVPDPTPADVDYGYGVGQGDGGWGPDWADGPTPAAALRALAAKLRQDDDFRPD